MVTVSHNYGKGVAPHHIFIGPGSPGGENVLQGNFPLLALPAHRIAFGRSDGQNIQKLTEGNDRINGLFSLVQQLPNFF